MRYLWRTLGGADQIERGGQALLALLDFREGSGIGRRVCRACSTVPDLPPDGQGFLVIEHCAEIEDVEITTARLASPKMFGLA